MGKGLKRSFSIVESSVGSSSKKMKRGGGLRKKSLAAKFKSSQGKSPETKFFDATINVNPVTAGTVTAINLPVLGTDFNQRVGRKIEMTSCSIDLMYAQSAAAFAAAGSGDVSGVNAFRVALVYDRQPTPGTAVTYQQIYDNITSVATPYQPRLVDNIERFEVLKVWNETVDTANRLSFRMTDYIKMNHEVRFNSTDGGTVADITTGTLYIVSANDVATGANNPVLIGVCRTRYRDL